ncbi:hypothetical protein JTE90_019801 [Oedothorax gibbosus]|uniref:Cyclic nucleotide-binding domain-containing protein n=1 Tax=Oedothorax gibbosus TaxID=931172 RepID=A0AAV6V8E5_9ARAC|nr:hypothetical protein JTE90_019801 [Oedothorax gibbosus]
MAIYTEQRFFESLKKDPANRNKDDHQIIYSYLHGLEALSSLREASLRTLCKTVHYEAYEANDILYCRGELSTCWFILLSGSVFIDGSMYLPRSSAESARPHHHNQHIQNINTRKDYPGFLIHTTKEIEQLLDKEPMPIQIFADVATFAAIILHSPKGHHPYVSNPPPYSPNMRKPKGPLANVWRIGYLE